MASQSGMFLNQEERASLVRELQSKGELEPGMVPESLLQEANTLLHNHMGKSEPATGGGGDTSSTAAFGTGCLACGQDDDHPNLLLCEGCNDEYHTYCLDPPLSAVPTDDWFCKKCKELVEGFGDDDGLDKLVCALPPTYTERFGEVCWAQGGVGFGWWPSVIYDPRLTVGNARQLARKNLGKKHLIYFFECHEAPFSVMTASKITKWEDGLRDDYHLGKAARATGKNRTTTFQQALQAANVEVEKPIERRMDWNHQNHHPGSSNNSTLPHQPNHQQQHLTSPTKPSSNNRSSSHHRKTGKEKQTISNQGGRTKRKRDQAQENNTASDHKNNKTKTTTKSSTNGKAKKVKIVDPTAAAPIAASSVPSTRQSGKGFAFLPENSRRQAPSPPPPPRLEAQRSNRKNLNRAIAALAGGAAPSRTAARIECSSEDGELYCTLVQKVTPLVVVPRITTVSTLADVSSTTKEASANTTTTTTTLGGGGEELTLQPPPPPPPPPETYLNVGFIKTRKNSTFASARIVIEQELVPDCIPADSNWKFLVPSLGPVSRKQEGHLRLLDFLQRATTFQDELGNGTMRHPLQVVIVDALMATTPTSAAPAATSTTSTSKKTNNSGGRKKRASRG